jgi:branched-chain amino acid transport system ATP-binding protein
MLKLENLHVHYDGIHALRGVSLEVPEGKIVSLIGANGAGKSTTLSSIVAMVKPSSGSITWNGADLLKQTTKEIVSSGIALVPEGRRVFPNITVEENLLLGAYHRTDKPGIRQDLEMVYGLFPRLRERMKQPGGTLSGGEQQMLAVGRGIMTRPKLFMLDEPSLGLAPLVVKMIFEIILEVNKKGATVLLVEQNARKALEISSYSYVLETGVITLEGPGSELLRNDQVRKAYLGD